MLKQTGILEGSFQASAAVSKFRFVVGTGDQTVARASVAGAPVKGVANVDISADDAARGKGCAVTILGVQYVESGAAFAREAELATDNLGRAITAASGQRVVAVAQKAAAGAGEWVPCLLIPYGRIIP